MSEVVLDFRQRYRVFLASEADRVTFRPGASRAADAMHIVRRILREVEVEDMAHVGNVQPT